MHARRVWRRSTVVMASVIATAGATLSVGPAAQAGPDSSGALPKTTETAQSTGVGQSGLTLDGVAPGPKTVTLVTGDQVRLTPVGAQYNIDLQPAASEGRMPRFLTQSGPNGVYVFPDDALPAVTAGRLDRELFNVKYLAENGYTDADATGVPVIVQYPAARSSASFSAAAAALPASEPTRTLESIHASAVEVSKARAGEFWATVRGSTPGAAGGSDMGRTAKALGAGITKVWLDRRVKATLDQSVPMIGAPQAWAAGHDGTGVQVAVLDSGVDLKHPDFEGRIAETKSFVPDVDSVQDGGGHGTHVASTITGTGAASDGKYRGVAPGVKLAVGKVLTDGGTGNESWVIEGMEWAARGGAKVVSMSLGAGPTDGTDPASEAVDALTAETGALFVVAAGNAGGDETVGTPGTADAALTVAAVDKQDRLAGFSSRGPRAIDGALKPDIAGPGVDIVAARAAGTTLPGAVHVGEYYTTISGTSMATPHVAAAAAILAQQHPDWTADQLKAALISSSRDDGYTVYEQGAGRVDLARADRQQVFATTPNVDYRQVTTEVTEPISKQVTYANPGDAPVTLTLTSEFRSVAGTPLDAVLSVDSSVTVPAHGTASATVTVDPTDLGFGRYTGAVVATAADIRVTTPVGLVREAPKYSLKVHTIGRDGTPMTPSAEDVIDVAGENGPQTGHTVTAEGTVVTRVPAGTYSVAQVLAWQDEDRRVNNAWLFDPEVTVTGDTEITLDARTATQLRFTTPKPSAPLAHFFYSVYQRTTASGARYTGALSLVGGDRLWAAPTRPVTTGSFWFNNAQKLARPELTMSVQGAPDLSLDPVLERHTGEGMAPQWVGSHPDFRHFSGTRNLTLVDVGLGRPEDLAGKDLRDKLVMMETDMAPGAFGPVCGIQIERIEQIRAGGAAGIIAFPSAASPCSVPLYTTQLPITGPPRPTSIPTASLSTREGLALRAKLTGAAGRPAKPVTIRVVGEPESPYSYSLSPYEDHVPDSMHYTYTGRQLAQVDLDFQNVPYPQATRYVDSLFALKRDQDFSYWTEIASPHTGTHRQEYIGPLTGDVVYQRVVSAQEFGPSEQESQLGPYMYAALQKFDRPDHIRQRWFAQPVTPGPQSVDPELAPLLDHEMPNARLQSACVLCRQGDNLWPNFYMVSSNNGLSLSDNMSTAVDADVEDVKDFTLRLYRGSTEIPKSPLIGRLFTGYKLPAETGTYRLVAEGPNTNTTWTFTSSRPTENTARTGYWCLQQIFQLSDDPCQPGGILFAGYDLGDSLDGDNTVAAGKQHTFQVNITQPQSVAPPKVAGANLWVSTDDGKSWTAVDLKGVTNGRYEATLTYPAHARTTGTVSLKVEAWDASGNRVEQTSLRAFGLRSNKKPNNAQ